MLETSLRPSLKGKKKDKTKTNRLQVDFKGKANARKIASRGRHADNVECFVRGMLYGTGQPNTFEDREQLKRRELAAVSKNIAVDQNRPFSPVIPSENTFSPTTSCCSKTRTEYYSAGSCSKEVFGKELVG